MCRWSGVFSQASLKTLTTSSNEKLNPHWTGKGQPTVFLQSLGKLGYFLHASDVRQLFKLDSVIQAWAPSIVWSHLLLRGNIQMRIFSAQVHAAYNLNPLSVRDSKEPPKHLKAAQPRKIPNSLIKVKDFSSKCELLHFSEGSSLQTFNTRIIFIRRKVSIMTTIKFEFDF